MKSSTDLGESSNQRKKRKVEATGLGESSETTTVKGPQNSQNEGSKPVAHEKRRRGHKLAALLGMPLDILFEILGHLSPYDLVKLSRTNKEFRALLLSKSSISVWKASLRSVPGLPECPPGMSEPAWANLVYSPHCHICLAPGVRNVEWRFRTRICSKCAKDQFTNLFREEIFEAMLMYEQAGGSITPVDDSMLRSKPLMLRKLCPSRRAKGAILCLSSDVTRVSQEYEALDNDVARKEYIQSRQKAVKDIEEHAARCEQWAATQVKDREEELNQLREERYSAIVKKLEDLGWGKDIESIRHPDSLRLQKPVNKPQRLTPRIWSNIKEDVLAYMQKIRETRLKREFEALVSERRRVAIEFFRQYKNSRLPVDEIMPGPADYCEFEPIKEILNSPTGVEVVLDSFVRLVPLLPSLIAEWRGKVDKALLAPIRAAKRESAWEEERELYSGYQGFDPYEEFCVPRPKRRTEFPDDELMKELKLATSIFSCRKCNGLDIEDDDMYIWGAMFGNLDRDPRSTILFYPQVIAHPCLHTQLSWSWPDDYVSTEPNYVLSSGEEIRVPWSATKLKFEQFSGRNAAKIVELSGLDPKIATSDEMDTLDLRFVCRLCPRDPQTGESLRGSITIEGDTIPEDCVLPVFDWRAAVRHLKDVAHGVSFIKVTKKDLGEEIMAAEEDHRMEYGAMWSCLKCRDLPKEKVKPMCLKDMKEAHYASKHNDISEPLVLGEHYYKTASVPNVLASTQLFFIYSKAGKLEPFKLQDDDDDDPDAEKVRDRFQYAR